ncbi:amidohydrolase family protein [Actinomadura sp. J1-007]|uniref:amidohydrolase family protein n=1 Tax=Actinomadura sp. J1-007 TaxID=2661913 RepID=UPI00281620CA|nr:amidohydrolase family protein [Actinomadura sp. J1-007]
MRHQVQAEPDPEWLLRPDVARGLTAVAAAGLVYDLVVLPHQLPACAEAAAAHPELTFVLDHLGKPGIAAGELSPWTAGLRALAALPNTTAKLSGLVTEADWDAWTTADLRPYTEEALELYGPDRLMFGSDWPVCRLAASYETVLETARELTRHLAPPNAQPSSPPPRSASTALTASSPPRAPPPDDVRPGTHHLPRGGLRMRGLS